MTMLVFALNASRDFGEQVADHLNVSLCKHEEREFEDGEHKIRPLENVRSADVFIVHSLYSEVGQSVNDKICRLLFFVSALRDAGANRITVLTPYFAYARKDRRTKTYDPVTLKYIANLFEAAGTDQLVSLDIHNLAAFQNAFRIPTEHLEARVLFAPFLADLVGQDPIVVVSPDVGGIKRVESFRDILAELINNDISIAFMEKKRSEGKISGEMIVGNVKDRIAIIVDDIVSSGSTILRAVKALQQHDSKQIFAVATHGIFVGYAEKILAHPGLSKIVITDSIPPIRLPLSLVQEKVVTLSASSIFAGAIQCIHEGRSVSEFLQEFVHVKHN